MHLDISLSFVNVGMPLSMQDKEKGLKEGHSLYLIKPLDVKVRVSLFIVRVFCYHFDFCDYLLYYATNWLLETLYTSLLTILLL